MIGWGEVTGKSMLLKGSRQLLITLQRRPTHVISLLVYPWDGLPDGTVICDVGGGNGHATLELARKFSKLKIVLQDQPAVIEQGKEARGFVQHSFSSMHLIFFLALGERVPSGYTNKTCGIHTV